MTEKKPAAEMTGQEMFDRGMAIRRQVLGDAYVDKALAKSGPFNEPLQELVTTYCWGWNWGREGLPLRDRSLINLAMIAILNRHNELKIHIRGALNNGLTRDEIREVLLQVGIYGGIPAAVDSFRLANEAFAEIDAEGDAA
ncbi:carboxymuconolactone decarboxylase family protein [Alteraurantiacibacter palmitatis]|uniref:Carboxymuconolactone decarboxylase family protein n=1 Tax=Alteraurantiacibacter palmitatis TaxID=2054628 RepID=A0ABV7E705_9SPHN